MFTDIVGFTTLTQADEAGALRLLQEQESLVGPLVERHRGRKVKSIGDGLLIEFPNALDAVECGVELQRQVHERNVTKGGHALQIRVGIHLGDVQHQGSDILGDAVNIASRVEPLAEAEGVCVSLPVYDQVHNKVEYPFQSLGPRVLKGVRDAVEIYRVVFPWTGEVPAATEAALPRVAILPLANYSPDPKDEYFADGMTEELISVLSQIGGLRVIARTSVGQYKGTTKPVTQIGRELGVSSVLEGSVRKAGDQLRITVQLIDTATQEHRWAQSFDRKFENVFAIQSEVAERTATTLKVKLLGRELQSLHERPTANVAAYEAFLRGVQAERQFSQGVARQFRPDVATDQDRATVDYLEFAMREDPKFSESYSCLANHLIGTMGLLHPATELLPRIRDLIVTALELNPTSSEAHVAAGNVAMQADLDWARAEEEFQQAISLNPSNVPARTWYWYLLLSLQRFHEAEKQILVAIDLDPLHAAYKPSLVVTKTYAGDYEAAIALCQQFAQTNPEYRQDYAKRLAWQYAFAGRTEAAEKLANAWDDLPDPVRRRNRAEFLAWIGKPAELRAMANGLVPKGIVVGADAVRAAGTLILLGKSDQALEVLEADFNSGERVFWIYYFGQRFDPIRAEPRFVSMVRQMHLPTTLQRPLVLPRPPELS